MIKNNYKYLKDISFLKELNNEIILDYYVKIIFLDWNQNYIKDIQQKVTSLNLTVDGQSVIRRTASLSFILQEQNLEDLFMINKKISIEIGYNNPTSKYADYKILWFPQGIYVITNYSVSHGIDSSIVSLTLKDKMCLLNGQCGGTLPAATVFDNYSTIDQNGEEIIVKPTIYQIIRQLVNHFGGEQLGKIIISDLDLRIKQIMKWTGASPLYFLRKDGQYYMTTKANEYTNFLSNGWVDVPGSPFELGNNIGYIYTNFTYPQDLIGEPGQTVVDILEQIKNTLGNYEYFYDLDGNFIFQQIKNYLNNSQSKYILESLNHNQFIPDYLSSTRQAYLLDRTNGKSIFDFSSKEGKSLIVSYSNTPQIEMIKNDFIIWGIKTTTEGTEIPIRYHLALDRKPQIGNTYKAFLYYDEDLGFNRWYVPIKYNNYLKFPQKGVKGNFYLDESTGEIYKWDKVGDSVYQYILTNATLQQITTNDWRTQLYFQGLAAQPYGTESNLYYTQLLNEWPKIFDIQPDVKKYQQQVAYSNIYAAPRAYLRYNTVNRYYYCTDDRIVYLCKNSGPFNSTNYQAQDMTGIIIPSYVPTYSNITLYRRSLTNFVWENHSKIREQAVKNSSDIDFYLDFIDTSEKIGKFSIPNIGRRTKVINEGKNANCIFEAWTPDIVLLKINAPGQVNEMSELKDQCRRKGQDFYQVPDSLYNNFAAGGVENSCYEIVRQLLHEYMSYNQSISLQTVPLYFLQPNTCIYVEDEESGIEGNFLITTLTYTIGEQSSLNINASKILQKI